MKSTLYEYRIQNIDKKLKYANLNISVGILDNVVLKVNVAAF